ncbi:pilin N-terminal domain-containing protein [Lacticaseibacillus jixiensis]|uniref:pilin N-terminal domain-containing protein n=1 Tax=Lacticaseibacillus jixiensis TaxID=3231926 RepID=UPI0036F1BF62
MTHAFLKKALTFIGAAALVVPLAMGLNGQNVSADDAPTVPETQNVTLTKYASQAYAENQSEQTDPTKAPDLFGKQTLEGAEFEIYDVTTKYWESDDRGDEAKIATDIQDASWYKEDKPTKTGTTDANGQFNVDLPTQSGDKPAVYLFVESKTPNGFKQSVNFIVALPMSAKDAAGKITSYPAKLYVYPKDAMPKTPDGKNHLKFVKVDKYNPKTFLAGAEFKITRVDKDGTRYALFDGKTSVTGYQSYSNAAHVTWIKNNLDYS